MYEQEHQAAGCAVCMHLILRVNTCRPGSATADVGHRPAVHTRPARVVLPVAFREAHQRGAVDRGGSDNCVPAPVPQTLAADGTVPTHAGQWLPQDPSTLSSCICAPTSHNILLCMQYLHGGWPEGLPKEEGPRRYGPKRSEWIRVDEVLA